MIRPRLALAAAAVLAATACGATPPPGELVPTLRTQLAQVDQALTAGDSPRARDALTTLAAQTATARDQGRITPDQADRILTAITRVAANLPEPTSPAKATPPAPTRPPPANTSDRRDSPQNTDPSPDRDTPGRAEQDGNDEDNAETTEDNKDEQNGQGEGNGNGKEKSKEPKQAGTENSEGPDDDHGN